MSVRNKYCSICTAATILKYNKGVSRTGHNHPVLRRLTGFKKSEAIHGLCYIYMIGDGDSSVYLSVTINVPYSLGVHKVNAPIMPSNVLEAVVKASKGE